MEPLGNVTFIRAHFRHHFTLFGFGFEGIMSDEMCLLDPTQVPGTKSFLPSFDYKMFRDPSRYTELIAFCGPQNRIFSIPHKWKTEPIRLYDLDLFEPTDPCLLSYISISSFMRDLFVPGWWESAMFYRAVITLKKSSKWRADDMLKNMCMINRQSGFAHFRNLWLWELFWTKYRLHLYET